MPTRSVRMESYRIVSSYAASPVRESLGFSNQQIRDSYKSSVTTPKYREKKRKRQLPWNPYYESTITSSPGTYVFRERPAGPVVDGVWRWSKTDRYFPARYSSPDISGSDIDYSLRQQAQYKALERVKSQQVNLPVLAAEATKTVSLIGETARRLALAYRSLRRGALNECAHILGVPLTISKGRERRFRSDYARNGQEAASKEWLALQYGWTPLLYDIHGSALALAELSYDPGYNYYTVTGVARNRKFSKSIRAISISPYAEADELVEVYAQCRFVIKFTHDSPSFERFRQLGFTNPALVAWELVPYSFVVDWFIDIGGWISGFDALAGINVISTSESLRIIKKAAVLANGNHSTIYESVSGSDSGKHVFKERRINPSTIPYAPTFSPELGVKRALSGIALLTQAFGRRR